MVVKSEFEIGQSFALIPDRLFDAGGSVESDLLNDVPSHLLVPDGVSYIVTHDGQVQLQADAPDDGSYFVIESIDADRNSIRGSSKQLLLVAPPHGDAPIVNASPTPRVVVLRERDQINLGDGRLLHVSVFLRPYVGLATEKMLSRKTECCLCRKAFDDATRVYVCPLCQECAHMESPEHKSGEKPLACVTEAATCPSCSMPVITGEGLTYVPEEVLHV